MGPATDTTPVIELRNVGKTYRSGEVETPVLFDVSFSVRRGEFVAIVGGSGSGKTTLLNIMGLLDRPTTGEVLVAGEEAGRLDELGRAGVRRDRLGFIFQFHYLLPEFTVLRNVMLPALKLARKSREEVEAEAMRHLRELEMADQALKMANQLSGGQKQRVAIARALINDPLIIMGDEPTGNLDKRNAELVFGIFQRIAAEHRRSLLIVTHDPDFAARTHRNIVMDDGRVVG